MSEPGPLALGFDGGATGTLACVLDARTGRVLGRGAAGSSNRHSVGEAAAAEALRAAASQALESAGRSAAEVAAACCCAAGVDTAADEAAVSALVQQLCAPGAAVCVFNDAVGALLSGTGGRLEGCCVVAGTGTIALGYARRGAGATPPLQRVCGWGPLFCDRGSAYDVGQRALEAAARAADGRGPPTALLRAVLEHVHACGGAAAGDADAAEALVPFFYAEERRGWAHVAALAPLVVREARGGDAAAAAIVGEAAEALADAAVALARKCGLAEAAETFPLVLAGGLLEAEGGQGDVATLLRAQLASRLPHALLRAPGDVAAAAAAYAAAAAAAAAPPT